MTGSSARDYLIDGGGSDTLDGGDGDDLFKTNGSGNHVYLGGDGANTVSYEMVSKGLGVKVDLTEKGRKWLAKSGYDPAFACGTICAAGCKRTGVASAFSTRRCPTSH